MADSEAIDLTESTSPAATDVAYIQSADGNNDYHVAISNIQKLVADLNANDFNVDDANGNELLEFVKTASAVNHIGVKNEATGNAPQLQAKGGDTNIDLELTGKGTGVIKSLSDLVGDQKTLYNFEGEINTQTGTTYSTADSDNGKIITLNNASAITLTIHQGAAAGFNCLIIQLGAGQVTVAAGGTGNVRNYDSETKLAGQYAMGSIFVVSNAGTAPEVYLAGRTGA